MLSMKCAMLIALTTGQRMQTLAHLNLQYMVVSTSKITFMVRHPLKTSKPGKSTCVEIFKYSENRPNICPYTCLQKYLEVTKDLRCNDSLFISYLKPHKLVGTQSLSRWITTILKHSGIDTKYGSHSVRHAASSRAAMGRVPIDCILSTVGWTNERVFAKFYRREVTEENSQFTAAVLSGEPATI
jgi:site-specific recombinase XerD